MRGSFYKYFCNILGKYYDWILEKYFCDILSKYHIWILEKYLCNKLGPRRLNDILSSSPCSPHDQTRLPNQSVLKIFHLLKIWSYSLKSFIGPFLNLHHILKRDNFSTSMPQTKCQFFNQPICQRFSSSEKNSSFLKCFSVKSVHDWGLGLHRAHTGWMETYFQRFTLHYNLQHFVHYQFFIRENL